MTSREKAIELVNKFYDEFAEFDSLDAKNAAQICVQEIILALTLIDVLPEAGIILYWEDVYKLIDDVKI
jgi:hypothetical protein